MSERPFSPRIHPWLFLGIAFTLVVLIMIPSISHAAPYRDFDLLSLLRFVVAILIVPTIGVYIVGHLLCRIPTIESLGTQAYWMSWCFVAMVVAISFGIDEANVGWDWWVRLAAPLAIAGSTAGAWYLDKFALPRFLGKIAPVFVSIAICYTATGSAVSSMSEAEALPGQSGLSGHSSASLYIIIFDELGYDVLARDGKIDSVQFPNIASLTVDSIWFTNAISNYYWSCQSLGSLMSGRFLSLDANGVGTQCPPPHLTAESVSSLPAILQQQFQLNIYDEDLRTCKFFKAVRCWSLASLTAEYPMRSVVRFLLPYLLPDLLNRWLDAGNAPNLAIFDYTHSYSDVLYSRFLDDITHQSRGHAYFVHVLLPHQPFVYDEQGRRHHSEYRIFTGDVEGDKSAYENYAAQVVWTDVLVGRLIAKLKANGLYDEATIIITGDHGPRSPDGFVGGRFPNELSDLTPSVPLLIKSPHLASGVSDIDYQHVDFLPTVRDLLGLGKDPSLEGTSIFDRQRPERAKRFHTSTHTYHYDAVRQLWIDSRAASGIIHDRSD